MNEVINRLKEAVASLQKLEEIFGTSKRTTSGVLRDLSDWIINENPARSISLASDRTESDVSSSRINSVLKKVVVWNASIKNECFENSLYLTAEFARNDLEDCILGLQTAIQILEEEQNNE